MLGVFKVSRSDGERVVLPRKVHTKSQRGCVLCKQRHLKVKSRNVVHQETDQVQCNEGKPVCGRCTQLQKACVSLRAENTTAQTDIARPGQFHASPCARMYSMSADVIQSDLADMLAPSSISSIGGRVIGSSLRALQHFQSMTSVSLGGELLRHVMHTVVAQSAWSKPYLMHMEFSQYRQRI